MEYKNSITKKGIIEIYKLKPIQVKVFLGLLNYSFNNIVDMKIKHILISDLVSMNRENLNKRINELCNTGLIVRCCNSAYFIDPSYALNGIEDDIYRYAESIENGLRNK